jgi:hypothetical protein
MRVNRRVTECPRTNLKLRLVIQKNARTYRRHQRWERASRALETGTLFRMFLTIEEVAVTCGLSVDRVYRIPRHELPYSRPGKQNLYDPADVSRYVRARRIGNTKPAANSKPCRSLIDSLADSVRERSTQKDERHDRI